MTVKKIALSLFLAGYAASGAFADVISAQTSKPIEGNAPVLTATKANAVDHTVTLRVTSDPEGNNKIGKGVKAKVGNYIVIKYKLKDLDGDLDNKTVANTLKVFTKINENDGWTHQEFNDTDISVKSEGEDGTISIRITPTFVGAKKIGFDILERTEFGLPYANKWLQVTNIWDITNNPNVIDPTDPANPTTTGPANPGTGNHGTGDGDEENGEGPVIGEDTLVGIFKYGEDGKLNTSVNYATENVVPKYGDKFGAIVWAEGKDTKNGKYDEGEALLTDSYSFNWTLAGKYVGPDNSETAANTTEVLGGTTTTTGENDTIVLGSSDTGTTKHNSLYGSAYKAGAQGYNLKVETTK